MTWPYVWRVKTRPLETLEARAGTRKGQRCRVLARGALNSALVEFSDGKRFITSRNYVRKAAP